MQSTKPKKNILCPYLNFSGKKTVSSTSQKPSDSPENYTVLLRESFQDTTGSNAAICSLQFCKQHFGISYVNSRSLFSLF